MFEEEDERKKEERRKSCLGFSEALGARTDLADFVVEGAVDFNGGIDDDVLPVLGE